jgi:hypothetical protein
MLLDFEPVHQFLNITASHKLSHCLGYRFLGSLGLAAADLPSSNWTLLAGDFSFCIPADEEHVTVVELLVFLFARSCSPRNYYQPTGSAEASLLSHVGVSFWCFWTCHICALVPSLVGNGPW